jgi:hypothetical protein
MMTTEYYHINLFFRKKDKYFPRKLISVCS